MVANITRTIEEIKEQAEHRGLAKGLEEGIEKGLEEGMEKGKLDVAKALLDILDDDTIAIKTGLPLAVIQDLRIKN